jgi:type 1 fimbriae regulatory protein FimB/type 1 fimbriae regulatory protein FimE
MLAKNEKKKQRQTNSSYRDREYLETDEIIALIEAAGSRGRFKERDRCLLLLMFRHGFRAGEAATLKWDAIDLESKQIKINRLKGSISGRHPLQPDEIEALIILRNCYPNSAFVFPAERGEHISVPGLERMFTRIGQVAGLKIRIHPHMMRHSCTYFLANKGTPIQDIQAWLGHGNPANTIKYLPAPKGFEKLNWSW